MDEPIIGQKLFDPQDAKAKNLCWLEKAMPPLAVCQN
jgi:hypothetical protein